MAPKIATMRARLAALEVTTTTEMINSVHSTYMIVISLVARDRPHCNPVLCVCSLLLQQPRPLPALLCFIVLLAVSARCPACCPSPDLWPDLRLRPPSVFRRRRTLIRSGTARYVVSVCQPHQSDPSRPQPQQRDDQLRLLYHMSSLWLLIEVIYPWSIVHTIE